MKKNISFLIAGFAILISILFFYKYSNPTLSMISVAGVIRSENESGWFVINDDKHTPLNIKSVEVEDGLIVVTFSFEAKKIHTFIVTPDETFAKMGYFVGASVSTTQAGILVSKVTNGITQPVDAASIKSALGNFWIYGLFSVSNASVYNRVN